MMDIALRQVVLDGKIPGKLFLSPLPGRYQPLSNFETALKQEGISLVVALLPFQEIEQKSPQYARKLRENAFPVPVRHFPIPDFGVPEDTAAFLELAGDLAQRLRNGEKILIHCAAGIGRTGTAAIAILMSLGFHYHDARKRVEQAGSYPEDSQEVFLIELAKRLNTW